MRKKGMLTAATYFVHQTEATELYYSLLMKKIKLNVRETSIFRAKIILESE